MPDQPNAADRIQKLEEGQAFSERAVEQLAGEVRNLGRTVAEVAAHLARLERRLQEARDAPGEASEEE